MSILAPYSRRNNLLSLLNEDINQLLKPLDQHTGWSQMLSGKHIATDIVEHENSFEIVMDAPGYNASDINIHIDENNLLTVTGKQTSKEKEDHDEKGKYLHIERESAQFFSRKIRLPELVNKEAIKADYKKGVLTISLPKTSQQKNKLHKITVKEITEE